MATVQTQAVAHTNQKRYLLFHPLCLDERANIFMYEYCKNKIAHITLFKIENGIRDSELEIEYSDCKITRR
jgi:hypothetical protein